MRPVRARTCVCCETVPQEQLGDPTRFLNGREVMEENLQAAMQVTKKATKKSPNGVPMSRIAGDNCGRR